MIKHIVFWRFHEQAEGAVKADNLRKAKALLDACAELVPSTLAFEVAIAQPALECSYDLVLYSALKPFIAAVRAERQCMDYEV